MKIAHIADCHYGLGYPGPNHFSRFEDIIASMNYAADRIIEEGCKLVLFAGDAFKDARVFLDRASLEITEFVSWLRKLSKAGIDVVVISGTPSHDAISAYFLIQQMNIPRIHVFTDPGHMILHDINISCLPGMNRSNIAANDEIRGLPAHEIHQIMTDRITEQCKELRSKCDAMYPTILMSHLTFDLADTGFEDALLQNEPILLQEATELFDLVALGHIHRPQKAGLNVYYSGAPERHNFGDEKTATGFWIHEIHPAEWVHTYVVNPKSRKFKTLRWCDMDIQAWLDGELDTFDGVNSSIVRVHYSCSEELQKLFDRQTLEKALYSARAYFVYEIKADIERTDRARDVEVTEALGPLTALQKWATNQGIETPEIIMLQSMTSTLLEGVAP
ncbi:exonuclease subunit SbcD [Paenibacillus psychroresistens]|uniref:Nuclease SbcCD subunit D n=1 Tax=Paenibacillus psychroresistens TaxID=1778678 RepID=A0A6B8RK89_9BACL|nr:exonuclease subunit SbcD [Paenibacillus psychroresistens]QGQ95836.1 exonuclease subunit SbcD [Paenibacillus psychroresistens]